MSRLLRCVLFLSVPLLMPPAHACLWDSDTLATEAKGLPDVVQVITGRFPRNPPLFYEMRLARVTKEIAAQPAKLELYDDAAVACDRLHRDKEAIAWMAKKRAQLKPFPQDKEHWYRYHANLGTFQAHDWLRSGANRKNLSEMKQARDNIAQAIKINPDAHFGREKVQLKVMEWIIKPPKLDVYQFSRGKLTELPTFLDFEKTYKFDRAVKGLTGLVVLGDAWQSVDVFYALAIAFAEHGDGTLSYLCRLRCRELIQSGKGSVFPGAPKGIALYEILTGWEFGGLTGDYTSILEKDYAQRRQEANEFQRRRAEFMMSKLKAGQHPDLNRNFWDGWVDKGAPELPGDVTFDHWLTQHIWVLILWQLFIFLILPIFVVVFIWRKWKAKRRLRLTT